MQTLLTHEGDREMFRRVYPFSPALVQTLVAVSSVLQRERTALKIMLQLLVGRRETLKVGDLIPAGDLWDVVAHGEEVFSDVMKAAFDNAKRLYQGKLRPLLEELNDVRPERDRPLAAEDPDLAKRLQRFDNDDRLVKTLLLSALVPEVEPLKDLTASRLAAPEPRHHQGPGPGGEGRRSLTRVRTWATRVGDIRVGEGPDPVIAVQIVGVDTGAILEKARAYDNPGSRIRKVKQLVFDSLGVADPDEMFSSYEFNYRGSLRRCDLLYDNVRDLPDASLRAEGDDWKVVVDWPFDDPGHTPVEDHARLDAYLQRSDSTRTLAWLPAFFSPKTQDELGRLVILDELLKADRLDQFADHLSAQDRLSARLVLENQRSALANALRLAVHAAYGIAIGQVPPGTLDTSHETGEPPIRSLDRGFAPPNPAGATLGEALKNLLDQALSYQYPDHPQFERRVTRSDCEKVLAEVQEAARAADGRVAVDRAVRAAVKLVANPLGLGHMGEQYFLLERHWATHFHKQLAAEGKTAPTVGELRAWMDRPRPRGLTPEVGNLVILAFAEQTDRSFFLHGRPFAPSLDRLPDGVELRPQPLPSEEEWDAARARAADVFGLPREGPELLTAANVASLAGKVEEAAEHARKSCHDLVREVRQALARLGVDEAGAEDHPRLKTARAVDGLLSGLEGLEPTAALRDLAGAPVATSAPAMGRSLAAAGAVSATLRDARWELFDAVDHLRDDRQPEAESLLDGLREALAADEYALPLVPRLEQAVVDAIRLLTPRRPRPGRRPATPGPAPGKAWRPVREGDVDDHPRVGRGRVGDARSARPRGRRRRPTAAGPELAAGARGAGRMSAPPITPHQLRVEVARVRRHDPEAAVIGLHAPGSWAGDAVLEADDRRFAVLRADTVLAVRQALDEAERRREPTVLLTPLGQDQLGQDVVARLARSRLFSVNPWDAVQALFGARRLDPALREQCLARALLEHVPPGGRYPPVPAGVLDAATAWRAVLHHGLRPGGPRTRPAGPAPLGRLRRPPPLPRRHRRPAGRGPGPADRGARPGGRHGARRRRGRVRPRRPGPGDRLRGRLRRGRRTTPPCRRLPPGWSGSPGTGRSRRRPAGPWPAPPPSPWRTCSASSRPRPART